MKYIFLIALTFSLSLCNQYYIVEKGDNLSTIAVKFNVTATHLCEWNNIANPNNISVGQRLIVSLSNPKTNIIVTGAQMRKLGWTNYNLDDLNNCLNKFQINTPTRIRHFITLCSLLSTLGKYTQESDQEYFCSKYNDRSDLGNTHPGDGCRFRGAGYFKLKFLGRYIYQKFANFMGDNRIMEGATYVSQTYPWSSAGFWWYNNHMNFPCDNGATVDQVLKKIYDGLDSKIYLDAQNFYKLACSIFE